MELLQPNSTFITQWLSEVNPVKFHHHLKSSPKDFPVPELNPISENSDRNAQNEFIWMNNNVFPKKVTFDGLVSFKLDGYAHLSDDHPDLLEAIKKKPVIYFLMMSGKIPISKISNQIPYFCPMKIIKNWKERFSVQTKTIY
jgi:hypothetical protein